MSRPAPERIETGRLLLRRPVTGDAQTIFSRYASDPDATRYLAWPRHQVPADTELFLDFSDTEWERYGCGPYLVISRASGVLLGSTGLTLEEEDTAQTGYVFARDAWGLGYATESLRAMVTLASSLELRQIYALCHTDHRASAHVLEKCGFTLEARLHSSHVFPNLGPHKQDALSYELNMLPRDR